jgi:hypothetical protein
MRVATPCFAGSGTRFSRGPQPSAWPSFSKYEIDGWLLLPARSYAKRIKVNPTRCRCSNGGVLPRSVAQGGESTGEASSLRAESEGGLSVLADDALGVSALREFLTTSSVDRCRLRIGPSLGFLIISRARVMPLFGVEMFHTGRVAQVGRAT